MSTIVWGRDSRDTMYSFRVRVRVEAEDGSPSSRCRRRREDRRRGSGRTRIGSLEGAAGPIRASKDCDVSVQFFVHGQSQRIQQWIKGPSRGAKEIRERILAIGGWGERTFDALPAVSEEEERANHLTGALGLLASLIAVGFLLFITGQTGRPELVASGLIYGASLVFSYGATTAYHGERDTRRKERLRVLDHCAVYALIAGSYTPLAIVGVGGASGLLLCIAVWALAGAGIVFKLRYRLQYPGTSVLLYILLGWIGIFTIGPITRAVGAEAMALIAAGGLAFTLGTLLFGAKRLRYHHAMWHLMVILGSGLHFVAVTAHLLQPTA